jgi:HME family heavy-metal exporter
VLAYYLLAGNVRGHERDSFVVRHLNADNRRLLYWAFAHTTFLFTMVTLGIVAAAFAATLLPRAFLPPFNEGTLTISLAHNPGISLAESHRLGLVAENLIAGVPEVVSVGRRTGGRARRARGARPLPRDRRRPEALRAVEGAGDADVRSRLAILPAPLNIGQPISHRLDHLLSGVRAEIALKIYGEDTDTLRTSRKASAKSCHRSRASSTCRSRCRCASRSCASTWITSGPRSTA